MSTTNKRNPTENLESDLLFLTTNLEKATHFLRHVDMQANILIGVCSGLFIFAISLEPAVRSTEYALNVLAVFSALSALFSLVAVHPPRFLRKQGQKESIMYHRAVSRHATSTDYGRTLIKLLGDRTAITQQYATEIYNIYKYTYGPKRTFFNLGKNLLLVGVFASLVTFVVFRIVERT
jgi:hypothetical protein